MQMSREPRTNSRTTVIEKFKGNGGTTKGLLTDFGEAGKGLTKDLEAGRGYQAGKVGWGTWPTKGVLVPSPQGQGEDGVLEK